MPLEIWTETDTDGIERAVLTDGRALLGLAVAPVRRHDQPGAVLRARPQKREAGDGRAPGGGFVACLAGAGETFAGFADRLPASVPEFLIVQVSTPARKTAFSDKAARVTADVTLPGLRVLYHPASSHGAIGWSRGAALPARAREEIAAAFAAALPSGVYPGCWTLRRSLRPEALDLAVAEARALGACWARRAASGDDPLWPAPPPAFRLLAGEDALEVKTIRARTQEDARRLALWRDTTGHGWAGDIAPQPVAERGLSLFGRAGFDEAIAELMTPVVTLRGGGGLVIETTEAMTVIDVNSASASRQDPAGLAREALREIARQIRLRNIGGTIVIDALAPGAARGRARMLADLRAFTADDPAPVEVFGIGRLGLIEMMRRRQGWALAEVLASRKPEARE